MVDIIFRNGDVVLAKYTDNDYTVYSMYYIGYSEPVILNDYETLSDGLKGFYNYTRRLS